MEIIKPLEIASKIMTLFSEAEKHIVIVSPYYNFTKWKKLNRVFEDAKKRGVQFSFYVRSGEYDSINDVKKIGFVPHEINMLHAKIYFNESSAIISSMNLNESSDNASLDIGMATETEKEYDSIVSFFKKFIMSKQEHIKTLSSETSKTEASTKIEIKNYSYETNSKKESIIKKESQQEKTNNFYVINSKYKTKNDFHLHSIYTFLKKNYSSTYIVIYERDSHGLTVEAQDFPYKGITLRVSNSIKFDFDDKQFYKNIKTLNKGVFEKQYPDTKFYWNFCDLNICPSEKDSYQLNEIGLEEKVNYFLRLIKNVSITFKKNSSTSGGGGYNRY